MLKRSRQHSNLLISAHKSFTKYQNTRNLWWGAFNGSLVQENCFMDTTAGEA
jgi:hypothetical protein